MSQVDAKKALKRALLNKSVRVIEFGGYWGTGKSYVWGEIKREGLGDTFEGPFDVKESIYLSLFGISTREQIEAKMLSHYVGVRVQHKGLSAALSGAAKSMLELFEKNYKTDGRVFKFLASVAPSLINDRLIVIDDIERRNADLSINTIMGLVEEYKSQRNCRFLLILNRDKVDGAGDLSALGKPWISFREKVVDAFVVLETTPAEAYQISFGKIDGGYGDAVRKCAELVGLNNVRVISAINRTVAEIFGEESYHPGFEVTLRRTFAICLAELQSLDYPQLPRDFERVRRLEIDEQEGEVLERAKRWNVVCLALNLEDLTSQDVDREVRDYVRFGILDVGAVRSKLRFIKAVSAAQQKEREIARLERDFRFNQHISVEALNERFAELAQDSRAVRILDMATLLELSVALKREDYVNIGRRWINHNPKLATQLISMLSTQGLDVSHFDVSPEVRQDEFYKTFVAAARRVIDRAVLHSSDFSSLKNCSNDDLVRFIKDLDSEDLKKLIDLVAAHADDKDDSDVASVFAHRCIEYFRSLKSTDRLAEILINVVEKYQLSRSIVFAEAQVQINSVPDGTLSPKGGTSL